MNEYMGIVQVNGRMAIIKCDPVTGGYDVTALEMPMLHVTGPVEADNVIAAKGLLMNEYYSKLCENQIP